MKTELLVATGLLLLSLATFAQQGRYTSLDQAVSEARERYDGRVLSADTEQRGGREAHNIRILTPDGRVKNLRMDANTGRFDEPARPGPGR
jgi:uncharacterized membrane protein YkoI